MLTIAMADPKGKTLYVNLAAAQVRRRLKGFGHGVRKIQSAGRNRAVVIHTAVGKHLTELERQFADVGCSSRDSEAVRPLDDLHTAPRFIPGDEERSAPA
jgi:hypothetical protein